MNQQHQLTIRINLETQTEGPLTPIAIKLDIDSQPIEEEIIRHHPEPTCHLILWNDDVNLAENVVKALMEVCLLSYETGLVIMNKAHNTGNAVVCSGAFEQMVEMKYGLEQRNLTATVEEIEA